MGLIYKIYCPVCNWLIGPGAWKKIDLRMGEAENLPLGLMQKSDGKSFSRAGNVNASDVPATFAIVKHRLMSAFNVWYANLWIDADDLAEMRAWIERRIRVVRDVSLPRKLTFIEAPAGGIKKREL